MRTSATRAVNVRSTFGKIVMAFAYASVLVGLSMGPAFGDERRREEERRHEEERRARELREHRPPIYVAPPPRVVYAPPPVVLPPPPPSLGLKLVIPIEIH